MKHQSRALALILALTLLPFALFSCAPQPQPIEGDEAIRAILEGSVPETDQYAMMRTPVWGEDVTGDLCVIRVDGGNRRATAASPAGLERTAILIGTDLYLYAKTPAEEEGGTPNEERFSLSLGDEDAALLAEMYGALPTPDTLAHMIFAGDVRAYRMPDGKYQIISENPDNLVLTEHTGYSFTHDDARELFFVTDTQGRLVYLRITGTAMKPGTLTDLPLYLEFAFNYDAQALAAPEDAAAFIPATWEEAEPLLPHWYW